MLPGSESLLRAQLALRLDTLLRQAQAGVTGPQPARPVGPVSGDPGLPSRAARDRQAQVAPGAVPAGEGRRQGPGPAAAAPLPAGAVATQLSAAARTLAAVLDPQPSGEPAPVRGAGPLWPHDLPVAAPELARALARAVESSGLFYESHLQQFADGTRTLEELRREPQAGLPVLLARPETAAAHAQAAAPEAPFPAPRTAPGAEPGTPAPAPPVHAAVIHPAAVDLVQQQLQVLACGVFRWSGEPWPGARMQWELQEDGSGRESPVDEAGRAWTTTLRLELPLLGRVEATLRLNAHGLQAHLTAADPHALRQLHAGRAALMQSFDDAGFAVRACSMEAA